jgi:hypothetical protein
VGAVGNDLNLNPNAGVSGHLESKAVASNPASELKALRQPAPSTSSGVLHVIVDYAAGDLAITEVLDALYDKVPQNFKILPTPVHSFKTTEAGFVLGQLALRPRDPDSPARVFYVNCAPRKDKSEARVRNAGEPLVYAELSNGNRIVAVLSGFSLSVVRDQIVQLHAVRVSAENSQFRSRDNFPAFVGAVTSGVDLTPWLGDSLDPLQVIPVSEEGYIGYIDSFGNIKTTYRSDGPLLQSIRASRGGDSPQRVRIEINGNRFEATVVSGSFEVPEGGLAFAPGSSGWGSPFWEIFMRGSDASVLFKHPDVGSRVHVELIK